MLVNKEDLPWPEKHRPRSIDQIVGNPDQLRQMKTWILSWKNRPPDKRAVLLIGPPGTGKTASIGALANDLDMEIVEFNSSDKRNKGSIETLVWRAASQQTLDGRPRIILLDEVDGLSGTSDRGGVGAIVKVIKSSVHPIMMTANDPDSPRLKDLYKICHIYNFEPIDSDGMSEVLTRIAKLNQAEVSQDIIDQIIENSAGDLRAAISDLEAYAKRGTSPQSIDSVIRDVRRGTEETLRNLFMTTNPKLARRVLSESELDHDSLILWLEENLHLHLLTADELDRGLNSLSLADLSLGRIMRNQNWKLLAYMYDFLAVGVAGGRTKTPYRKVSYSKPTWPLLVWSGNQTRDKRTDVLSSLSKLAGISKRRVTRTHLDTILEIIGIAPSKIKDYADWLSVDKASLKMRGTK
ncbi:replication factor C large subunit [Candidatus Thorarchaeota archaeon]|jgi:replication factor C large subunit|nr:MAG: replication factor C large subunit [Candidatus Thorarchaeota archaeon]